MSLALIGPPVSRFGFLGRKIPGQGPVGAARRRQAGLACRMPGQGVPPRPGMLGPGGTTPSGPSQAGSPVSRVAQPPRRRCPRAQSLRPQPPGPRRAGPFFTRNTNTREAQPVLTREARHLALFVAICAGGVWRSGGARSENRSERVVSKKHR
jgi:hypothetical protein